MQFGLSDNTVLAIQNVLKTHFEIQKVIIYGSRAKGNYKNGSDVDLVIIGPKLSVSELLQLENELDELLLPYKFDLSLYHYIDNADLLDHIKRIGLVFYLPVWQAGAKC